MGILFHYREEKIPGGLGEPTLAGRDAVQTLFCNRTGVGKKDRSSPQRPEGTKQAYEPGGAKIRSGHSNAGI
jgi:hypothetical protein